MKLSNKAHEASSSVAKKVAKKVKPHTIAGTVILTACQERVGIMFGEDVASEVNKNPLSDNTKKCAPSRHVRKQKTEPQVKNNGTDLICNSS